MKRLRFVVPALALVLTACGPKPVASTEPAPNPADTPAKSGEATPPTEPPAPKLADLPVNLKNAAFDYYGLANDKPMDMEVIQNGSTSAITGSQSNTLKSIDGQTAVFSIDRTGGLAQMGTQTVRLKADGIYLDEVMGTKIKTDEVELPADLAPGKTWKTHLAFSSGASSMDITTISTVMRVEKFKTKVAEREGLLVVSSGSGKLDGKDVKLDSKSWYVKGLGGVKNILTTTYKNPKDGKPQTLTIQETK